MKRASEAPFPYGWPGRVLYFMLVAGEPRQLSSRDELRSALAVAISGLNVIYAAWPGQYRTDLFIIDKPELLAEAIGLVTV